MPVDVNELPELIITSKTQSSQKIKEILASQGYDVSHMEEQTDDPPAVEVPPADPGDTAEVIAEPTDATPPAVETTRVAEPTEPAAEVEKKKSGAARYKAQRDEARAELERIRLENAKKDGELEELRRQPARTEAPAKIAELPVAADTDEPIPDPVIAPKPKLELPKMVRPLVTDPQFDNDFDKWQEAVAAAEDKWREQIAAANEDYNEKFSDWKDQKKDAERAHAQAIKDRQEKKTRTQTEADKRNWEQEAEEISAVGRTIYPDYDDEAKKDRGKIVCSHTMGAIIRDFGKEDKQLAADLIYWIAKHPDEAHEIAKATAVPEKDGKAAFTQEQWNTQVRKAHIQMMKIAKTLTPPEKRPAAGDTPPAAPPVDAEVDPPDEEEVTPTPEVTAPVPPAPAPSPAPAAGPKAGSTPPPVKPQPMKPVGAGGGSGYKRLENMTAAEKRNLSPDQYRERWEKLGERG